MDSCVYLDYFCSRQNKAGKDLSEPAKRFFAKVLSKKHQVIISDWVIDELDYTNIFKEDSILICSLKKNKQILSCGYSEEEVTLAKQISVKYYKDVLHVLLAEKMQADVIITRNTPHFYPISKKIKVLIPEHFVC